MYRRPINKVRTYLGKYTFGLEEGKLLILEKTIYGLEYSGEYWAERFSSHVTGKGE